MVTFTCQVNGSLSLQWHGPLISQDPIVFSIDPAAPVVVSRSPLISQDQIIFSIDPAAPVVVSRSSFIATLTSITRSGSNSDFTSTLQVNASRRFARSDTTVECRNQLGVNESSRFTVAGITMLNIFSQMHIHFTIFWLHLIAVSASSWSSAHKILQLHVFCCSLELSLY